MNDPINLFDPFFRGLGCAALDPELNGILINSASYDELEGIASIFSQMIQAVSGKDVKMEWLNVTVKDEELWGSPGLTVSGEITFRWRPGILTEDETANEYNKLILIPDLALLNIAALRAIIQVQGTDNIIIERQGYHFVSRCKIYFIGRYSHQDQCHISPHVLDRFPVKTHIHISRRTIREELYRSARFMFMKEFKLRDDPFFNPFGKLPIDTINHLVKAKEVSPVFTEKAFDRIFEHLEKRGSISSFRSPVALARLSRAYAMLDQQEMVETIHVDEAAEFLGLYSRMIKIENRKQMPKRISGRIEMSLSGTVPKGKQDLSVTTIQEESEEDSNLSASDRKEGEAKHGGGVLLQTEAAEGVMILVQEPASQKVTQPSRPKQTLQLPINKKKGQSTKGGIIIGYERAKNLKDISIFYTLLEAAKYQRIRSHQKPGNRFWISPIDFQSYRRARIPETILILLIDFTCIPDEFKKEALVDQLRWAYSNRALVYLIRVGAADAYNELRSEKILGQNILTPRIGYLLDAEPGLATPLAHGLELTHQILEQYIYRGYGDIPNFRLVVLSDGRGNVTLEDSRNNKVSGKINREGIDDALKMARRIKRFHNVEKILLNPVSKHYKSLPLSLAHELGAEVIPVFIDPEGDEPMFTKNGI